MLQDLILLLIPSLLVYSILKAPRLRLALLRLTSVTNVSALCMEGLLRQSYWLNYLC